jgi:hypothetical protein
LFSNTLAYFSSVKRVADISYLFAL